jgi:hypothetical protein
VGAGAVAFVNPLLNAIGLGRTSVLVASVWILISPVVLIVTKYGPRWREEARLKGIEKERQTNAARQAADGNEQGVVT